MTPPLSGKFLLTLPQSDLASSSTSKQSVVGGVVGGNNDAIGKSQSRGQQMRQQRQRRPDLVLFQVPDCLDDILAGKCQILANDESASIVTPTSSLQLVTVGTSNSLVVWKQRQQQQRNDGSEDGGTNDGQRKKKSECVGEASSEPSAENTTNDEDVTTNSHGSNKRSKTVTSCRLIQPGGSGASFLVGQSNPIQRDELLQFFAPVQHIKHVQSSQSQQQQRRYSTETLSNLFQCSNIEMEETLSQIPTIVAFQGLSSSSAAGGGSTTDAGDDDAAAATTNTSNATTWYWQLIPEEEVLYGQKALVQMLVEEEDDNDNDRNDDDDVDESGTSNGNDTILAKLNDLTNKVSVRLLPILLEHESEIEPSETETTSSSVSRSRVERSKAIAQKTILLAETKTRKGKIRHPNHCRLGDRISSSSSSIRIDPNMIAFYVLRDLFIEQSSYTIQDFLSKWTSRLPFGDKYERIIPDFDVTHSSNNDTALNPVTIEWLTERNIIPSQLSIKNLKMTATRRWRQQQSKNPS